MHAMYAHTLTQVFGSSGALQGLVGGWRRSELSHTAAPWEEIPPQRHSRWGKLRMDVFAMGRKEGGEDWCRVHRGSVFSGKEEVAAMLLCGQKCPGCIDLTVNSCHRDYL